MALLGRVIGGLRTLFRKSEIEREMDEELRAYLETAVDQRNALRVMGLVLGRSAALIGCGIVVGVGSAAALTRYLQGMLFGLTPLDPATFVAVSVMFAAVATLAAWVPARRATKVDPMIALRE